MALEVYTATEIDAEGIKLPVLDLVTRRVHVLLAPQTLDNLVRGEQVIRLNEARNKLDLTVGDFYNQEFDNNPVVIEQLEMRELKSRHPMFRGRSIYLSGDNLGGTVRWSISDPEGYVHLSTQVEAVVTSGKPKVRRHKSKGRVYIADTEVNPARIIMAILPKESK